MRVNLIHDERQHRDLFFRRAYDTRPLDFTDPAGRVVQQIVFVFDGAGKIDRADIIECRAQANSACYVRRPSLELVGNVVVFGSVKSDFFDHFAPALIRWQCFQEFPFSIQYPNSRRRKYLMTGKSI